jgi:hypothetical protein
VITPKYRVAKRGIDLGTFPTHSMAMQAMCIDAHKSKSPLTDYNLYTVTAAWLSHLSDRVKERKKVT